MKVLLQIYIMVSMVILIAVLFGKEIEIIDLRSRLYNLQRQTEAYRRTMGLTVDPAYVCYSASTKQKLQDLLEGRLK